MSDRVGVHPTLAVGLAFRVETIDEALKSPIRDAPAT
jgi:hypothetical protein